MSAHEERALHDDEPLAAARRKGRVAAAGHGGDVPAARTGLSDASPSVRGAALGALARIGSLADSDLEQALSDPSPAVRRRAAELSWRSGLPEGELVTMLTTHLDDEDQVVEAICAALGELQARTACGALAAVATGHTDPLCREAAVAALGAIGAVESLPSILAALGDRPAVRRRAVLALAAYEGPEVDAALAASLEDRDWQVRQAAEDLSGSRTSK